MNTCHPFGLGFIGRNSASLGLAAILFAPLAFAVNVAEGPDFPNVSPGAPTVLTLGNNVFSGTLTTPGDGQDRFDVTIPVGLRLKSVTKFFAPGGSPAVQSPNCSFNGEDLSGTGTANFVNNYPLAPGTYSAIVSAGLSVGNAWSLTFVVEPQPDYAVTTSSGFLSITDLSGNSDTLSVTNPVAGNIKFTAPGRIFSVNGGPPLTNETANISLAGINDVSVSCGNGNDTVNVSAFSGSTFPGLFISGGSGNDTVNLNGDITFTAGRDLDVDLQNNSPATNTINVAANANLITSGSGYIYLECSRNFSMASGSSLEVENGDLYVLANQQTTATTGNFVGVNLDNATIKSTGSGILTVNGRGGNDPGGYQLGVQVINGAKIIGGYNFVFVTGTGGNSTGIVNRGTTVYGAGSAITSLNGSVYVTGRAGQLGTGFGIGVAVLFSAEISAGGNGLVTVQCTGDGASGGFNQGLELGGAGSRIYSAGRNVSINCGAGPGSSFGIYLADSSAIFTPAAGGSIEFYSDSLSFDSTVSVTTTNSDSHVRFKPAPFSNNLDLGGADAPGFLGLTVNELARVNTANLEFYNPSGGIIISDILSHATATNVTFLTAVNGVVPAFTGLDVFLPAAGTVNIIQSSPLTCAINGPAADTDYARLTVQGKVNLTGATLVLTGSYSGAVGDSFTIVQNLGIDPIVGNFIGLPQGSYLNLNGQPARIYYDGGDGNDVVLVRSLPQLTATPGLTNGNWQFTGIGIASNTYTIQATTNFITWTNIGIATGNSNGNFTFTDTNAFLFPYRFYRTTN